MKIYLDTCIVIYFVERHAAYASIIESSFVEHAADIFCCSSLVRLECLVKPYQTNDGELLKLYEAFLKGPRMLDLTLDVCDEAARLRAAHQSLKTPDALHLAAALRDGCTEFWTNDHRLDTVAPQITKNVVTP